MGVSEGGRKGGREGGFVCTLRGEVRHHKVFEHGLDGRRGLGLRKGGRKGIEGGPKSGHRRDEGEVEGVGDVEGEGGGRSLGACPEGRAGAGDLREGGRERGRGRI